MLFELGFDSVCCAAWRGPPELGSLRFVMPGLVQGYPGLVGFPLAFFLFGLFLFWFCGFVGVGEVLNSVLSVSKEAEHTPELVALTVS